MSTVSPEAVETANSEVGLLILANLRNVARSAGLPVSGAKAVLQRRINDKLSDYASANDMHSFERLRALVSKFNNSPKADPGNELSQTHAHRYTMSNGNSSSSSSGQFSTPFLSFKDSPFFDIQSPVTAVQELKVRESTRDQLECGIRVSPAISSRFAQGENLRFLIYCAPEPSNLFKPVDIAFPTQIEIKVNGNDIKANLRGLKQKPGSTRPADITDLIHKRASYENILTVTYALTTKKYYLVVNVVKQISAETLVDALKTRRPISKQQVVKDMVNKAQDSDIQATSSIMSLKCPISTLRMDVPCRSTACAHNQCYDALSYLQLQEQAPTWVCPVCHKSAPYETIQTDQYVEEILKSTPSSTEQVAVEPNGVWSEVSHPQAMGARSSSSEDDDLVEISEPSRLSTIKHESTSTSLLARTPPRSSREQSTASTAQKSNSGKRPALVIDLTLSDDDDPPRPTKRQAGNSSGAGYNTGSGLTTQYSQRGFNASMSPAGFSFSIPRQSHRTDSPVGFGS